MRKIEKYTLHICVIVFFVIQLYLNFCYPLTSDSLLYKHSVYYENGKELLEYVLKWGNGRFLGNLGGVIMSKIEWLRIIWTSICLTGIYILLINYTKVTKKSVMVLLGGLLLFPSVKMYAQVYVWSAGFQNYVVPLFLFLFAEFLEEIKKENKTNIRLGGGISLLCSNAVIFRNLHFVF